jgi:hypothetical protein
MFTLPKGTRPFASRVKEAVDGRGGRIVPAPRMMVILWSVWCKGLAGCGLRVEIALAVRASLISERIFEDFRFHN